MDVVMVRENYKMHAKYRNLLQGKINEHAMYEFATWFNRRLPWETLRWQG